MTDWINNATFGSLFAGVGGFDLGFEQAGFDCKFQVEWDDNCQQTLAHHWPDIPRWGDVSEVNGADLPPVDVITYGFPCQDLSVAGKRAGLDGERSNLFFQAIRIIQEMRQATNGQYPTFAVAENVAGLLNADKGDAMARVLDTLAEAGALVIEWCMLDAQWFGVPQRRRRVFVTACFDPATADRCPDQIFPVAPSGTRNPQEIEQARQKTASTFGDSPESRSSSPNTDRMTFTPTGFTQSGFAKYTEEAGTLTATDHKRPEQHVVVEPFVKAKRAQNDSDDETWEAGRPNPTINQFDQGDSRATTAIVFHPHFSDGARPQPDGKSPACTAFWGTGGNNGTMIAQETTHDVIGTLQERAYKGPNHENARDGQLIVQHDTQPNLAVRRLTPLECERLMGWPDDHTLPRADGKHNSDSTRYRMCGNGVVAPVATWIAKHLHPLL